MAAAERQKRQLAMKARRPTDCETGPFAAAVGVIFLRLAIEHTMPIAIPSHPSGIPLQILL